MKSRLPTEQKRLGGIVMNFDGWEWKNVSLKVMEKGLRAKFSSPDKIHALLQTGDMELVEASPTDR